MSEGVSNARNCSPLSGAKAVPSTAASSPARPSVTSADALSKLPPAQVREMREAFSILDRDSTGNVGREDVADMLGQLGMSQMGRPHVLINC
jgi:hypothetical protein